MKISNTLVQQASAVALGLSMLAGSFAPLTAAADQSVLAITCDTVTVNGNSWTFTGTWKAFNFAGQDSQYDVAVFSPSGVSVANSSKTTPNSFATTSQGNLDGGHQNDDMQGTWSNTVTFASAPTEVFASLYHAQIPGNEKSGDAQCQFTLPSINHAPVANNDSYSTNQDTVLVVATANGVLANDTDADNNTLTALKDTDPSHGSLTLGTDGSFTYTPTTGYSGSDSFTYHANDGQADSNVATVNITVNASAPTNTTPVATPQALTVANDSTVSVVLSGSDADVGDTLTFATTSNPAHGTLTGTIPNLTYTPNSGYEGQDSFMFTATDNHNAVSVAAPIDITVTCGAGTHDSNGQCVTNNTAPVAADQVLTTDNATALPVTLTALDAQNDPLTFATTSNPTNGTLTGTAPNLTYTPNAGFEGTDSFTFTASDASLTSNTATISITVTCSAGTHNSNSQCVVNNTAPVADNQTLSTIENTALNITLTATDTDGDALTFLAGAPSNGVISGTGANVTYTPNTGYTGPDSFTFEVNDGQATSTGTVDITVSATPVDLCPNLPGTQTSVPAGWVLSNNQCTGPGGGIVQTTTGHTSGGGGSVLGASTSTPQVLGESCGVYMDKFLRVGSKNDSDQTMKLQTFLNKWMDSNLPVTGFFGKMTEAAVKAFQAKYSDQVLAPWNITSPTGIAYYTTLRQVNLLECPSLTLDLPSTLVEWSKNPNVSQGLPH